MNSEKSINDNTNYKKNEWNEEFDINKFTRFIIRNKILILSITSFSILLSGAYGFLNKKIWQGQFQIVITNNEKNIRKDLFDEVQKRASPGLSNLRINNRDDLFTQITILKSPSVLLPVFNYVKQYKKEKDQNSRLKFRNWVSNSLDVYLEEKTSVLNVLYRDSDKEFIKSVLKKISDTYQIYSRKNKEKGINDGIKYLNSQLSIFKEKSKSSSKKLIKFSYENDVNELLDIQKRTQILGDFSNPKEEINIYNLKSIENELRIYKDENTDPKVIVGGARTVSKLVDLTSELDSLENEISYKENIYASNDPELKNLRLRKNTVYNNLKLSYINYLEALKVKLEAEKSTARKNIDILQKHAELKNEADQDLRILTELDFNLRNLLLTKAKSIDPWELITQPTLQSKSISPGKKVIVFFGLLFGLSAAILLAFYQEKKSDLIFEKDYIQKYLNFKCLETFKNSNKESWDESISVLSRGSLIASIKDLTILNLSINEEDFELIKNKLQTYIPNKNILFTNSLVKVKNNSHLILGIEVGSLRKTDLLNIKNKLVLMGNPIVGLIIFEN